MDLHKLKLIKIEKKINSDKSNERSIRTQSNDRLNGRKTIIINKPQNEIKQCVVRLSRFPSAQIDEAASANQTSTNVANEKSKTTHSSYPNVNDNAKADENSKVSEFSFNILIVQDQNLSELRGNGTETRAMKRKRSEINMKPNILTTTSPKKI